MKSKDEKPDCGWLSTSAKLDAPDFTVIVQDFYDGPTEGVVGCYGYGVTYKFEMLDWDDKQDIRIFRTSPLSYKYFAEIVKVYSQYDQPRWPVWMPNLSKLPKSLREDVYRKVDLFLDEAEPISCIVAWQNSDLQLIKCKSTTDATFRNVKDWLPWENSTSNTDWFSLMNLTR